MYFLYPYQYPFQTPCMSDPYFRHHICHIHILDTMYIRSIFQTPYISDPYFRHPVYQIHISDTLYIRLSDPYLKVPKLIFLKCDKPDSSVPNNCQQWSALTKMGFCQFYYWRIKQPYFFHSMKISHESLCHLVDLLEHGAWFDRYTFFSWKLHIFICGGLTD